MRFLIALLVLVCPAPAYGQSAGPVGRVSVTNLPANQPVTVTNLPATQPVSGTVSIANLPASQPVSGTVAVSNFPATQAVTGAFWPATQPVSGAVTVSNLPATQPVSGTVAVSNFPTGSATAALQSQISAQLPATLGAKTAALSLPVALPTDQGPLVTLIRGASGIASGQAAVTTTATLVVPARAGRQRVVVTPIQSVGYYVGAAGITTATGAYVGPAGAVTIDTASAVYAVVPAGVTLTLTYLESF